MPNVGKDWVVRPLTLVGDQELVFEEGTVVTANVVPTAAAATAC